jgi:hypothetical protein
MQTPVRIHGSQRKINPNSLKSLTSRESRQSWNVLFSVSGAARWGGALFDYTRRSLASTERTTSFEVRESAERRMNALRKNWTSRSRQERTTSCRSYCASPFDRKSPQVAGAREERRPLSLLVVFREGDFGALREHPEDLRRYSRKLLVNASK